MNKKQNIKTSQKGFTLLEVMIAMVIFSIGLLGLASLQAISFQTEHASYSRSQAILLAYDMSDRISANADGSVFYVITATTTTVTDYSGSDMCVANSCATTNMVTFDLGLWKAAVAALLPAGQSAITRNVDATTGAITHTITVHWDEDRTGVSGINCPVQTANDLRCFQLKVSI